MQPQANIGTARVTTDRVSYGLPFYFTLVYLVLEYGRPQMTIPGLTELHLPGIVVGLLAVMLVGSWRIDMGEMQTRLFMTLLVWMAVHIPFAVNNYWAYHTTRAMLITFVAYLAIVTFVDSFEKFQAMITTWIGIHIYLAINGFIKEGRGIGGFLGDENDFALALNMVIPFGFFLAMEAKTKIKRLLLLIITGGFLICNVATFSRGGFVGLVAVAFYCWIRSPRKVLSIFVVILLISTMVYLAPEKYWTEMQTIVQEPQSLKGGTSQVRIYSWKAAWRMFLDHPIFGVGPGNFEWNFERYEPPEGLYGRTHGGRSAHSLYFTLMPDLGIPGIVIFLFMLKVIWKDRKKIMKLKNVEKDLTPRKAYGREIKQRVRSDDLSKIYYLNLAIGGSLTGYFVSGAFLSVLYYPNFWILLAFTTALKKIVYKSANEGTDFRTVDSNIGTTWPVYSMTRSDENQ